MDILFSKANRFIDKKSVKKEKSKIKTFIKEQYIAGGSSAATDGRVFIKKGDAQVENDSSDDLGEVKIETEKKRRSPRGRRNTNSKNAVNDDPRN